MGNGKQENHCSHNSRPIGCLWYSRPQLAPQSPGQKVWNKRHSPMLVWTISQTKKIQVCINGNYSQEKTLEFSVPQGSTQGAYLFIRYASTLNEVVPKDLQLSGYVDDHSIWKCFKIEDESNTMVSIESTMLDMKCWMDAIYLKMNESKIEFIYFWSKQMLKKCHISTVNINGEHTVRSNKVKYLGSLLDSTISFCQHVIAKCQAANIKLQKIRWY